MVGLPERSGHTPVALAGIVRPLAWLLRLAAIVGAGALLLTAVVVAAAPRAVAMSPTPTRSSRSCSPSSTPLAQRTYVYDLAAT